MGADFITRIGWSTIRLLTADGARLDWNAIYAGMQPGELAEHKVVMGKAAVVIGLDAAERRELQSLVRAQKTGQAMARRARIVLAAAAGMENKAICVVVGADANTVGKWRRRFAADRLDGLLDG